MDWINVITITLVHSPVKNGGNGSCADWRQLHEEIDRLFGPGRLSNGQFKKNKWHIDIIVLNDSELMELKLCLPIAHFKVV